MKKQQHHPCDQTPAHVKPCFANVRHLVLSSSMDPLQWISLNNPRRSWFLYVHFFVPWSNCNISYV